MIERNQWVHALTTLPHEQLLAVTCELSDRWSITPRALSQSGLGMLKLNDSAFEEPFYLGEFPLSSAWLEVCTDDGQTAEGAAQVMDDRMELAEALALCDAILSARLPGWEKIDELLERGMEQRRAQARERQQMLAGTRVDFSLLDDVADDNGEDDHAER